MVTELEMKHKGYAGIKAVGVVGINNTSYGEQQNTTAF